MELVRHTLRKGHKAIEREVLDWNPQGKGGEGNVDIRGEELSTMRHQKKGRAGLKKRLWPEIGPDGGVLLTPYVPWGIIGIDYDDGPSRYGTGA